MLSQVSTRGELVDGELARLSVHHLNLGWPQFFKSWRGRGRRWPI